LRLLYRELFLKPATAAADDGPAFIPQDFYSNRFFSASWAGEELWQSLLWDMNNLFPSSTHLEILGR
jgi:hypothetical protein